MSRSNGQPVQSTGEDRVLSLGAVRVHNNHLQKGHAHGGGCAVCQNELEGALTADATFEPRVEVVESDGADEDGDPALPSGGWDSQ